MTTTLRTTALVALVSLLGVVITTPAVAGDEGLDERIEAARAKLDAAARELAQLHSSSWGSEGKRLMLGILVGDRDRADGLVVSGITPGGGAEAAGLEAGDRILSVGAELLNYPNDVKGIGTALANLEAGASVPVTYVRDGDTRTVDLTPVPKGETVVKMFHLDDDGMQLDIDIDDLSDLSTLGEVIGLAGAGGLAGMVAPEAPLPPMSPAPVRLLKVDGSLASYFDVDAGVVVLELDDAVDGLQEGDVLLAIDDKPVRSVRQALKALQDISSAAQIEVKREGRERSVTVPAFAEDLAWIGGRQTRVIRIDRD